LQDIEEWIEDEQQREVVSEVQLVEKEEAIISKLCKLYDICSYCIFLLMHLLVLLDCVGWGS